MKLFSAGTFQVDSAAARLPLKADTMATAVYFIPPHERIRAVAGFYPTTRKDSCGSRGSFYFTLNASRYSLHLEYLK